MVISKDIYRQDSKSRTFSGIWRVMFYFSSYYTEQRLEICVIFILLKLKHKSIDKYINYITKSCSS